LPDVRGRIAMLEMGEPVRIVDLAKSLLDLSGLRRAEGSHILYTGLRPGQRLHEELVASDEATIPTVHEKARVVCKDRSTAIVENVRRWEDLLAGHCTDADLISELSGLFPELQALRALDPARAH